MSNTTSTDYQVSAEVRDLFVILVCILFTICMLLYIINKSCKCYFSMRRTPRGRKSRFGLDLRDGFEEVSSPMTQSSLESDPPTPISPLRQEDEAV